MQTSATEAAPPTLTPASLSADLRRYDVDWLRTLALGLLIIYHNIISFQPWATQYYFIPNPETLEALWPLMDAINVWRIPLLFMVSGMGVYFALRRRTWQALLTDRAVRILLPYVFGLFCIGPVVGYFVVTYLYGSGAYVYTPIPAHLWFLANLFSYVVLLLPAFLLFQAHPQNSFFTFLRAVFRAPLGIFVLALPIILEGYLLLPYIFTDYAETWHGFWLGLLCFFLGFVGVALGDDFWDAVKQVRYVALAGAIVLFLLRQTGLTVNAIWYTTTGLEAMSWMLAIFGFSALYLNHPSRLLRYLSAAVYPVYIFHLPVQYAISYYLIPTALPAVAKLAILIISTFAISFALYELTRRIPWVRPLFGMKWRSSPPAQTT